MEQSRSYKDIIGRYRHFIEGCIYLITQGFGTPDVSVKWRVPDYTQRDLEKETYNGWNVKFLSPYSFQLSRL